MAKGTVFTLRLQADLLEWVTQYAKDRGSNRNELTREMYEALQDGRLFVAPRQDPNPFPGDEPLFPEPPTNE